jgi:RNA polymerase sigma factor (sigma-70 family)
MPLGSFEACLGLEQNLRRVTVVNEDRRAVARPPNELRLLRRYHAAVFPTTLWTTIRAASGDDARAREEFATRYRAPVLRYLRRRGFPAEAAEDVCQEVFVRIFENAVLARADRARGKFRGLLLVMTQRVAIDHLRKADRREVSSIDESQFADESVEDSDFDSEWALAIVRRAMDRLREDSPGYAGVLEAHLKGENEDRQKLWIARRKLAGEVRREIAMTCDDPAAMEEELAHLSRYLDGRVENS